MISGISSLVVKRSVTLICLIASAWLVKGQTPGTTFMADSAIKKDSTRAISFLVVPFNTAMYFSDADKDISEFSQLPAEKVKDRFNGSLEAMIDEEFGLYYKTVRLSKQGNSDSTLDLIYGSITYKPEDVKEEKPEQENNPLKKLSARKDKKPTSEKKSYMNISGDKRLFQHLAASYGTDYFIFINQFEIKTDYENCIDLQMRKYYRELNVHYSVFSKNGEWINGGIITVPYHSNENKIEVIIQDNFSVLTQTLLEKVYLKK